MKGGRRNMRMSRRRFLGTAGVGAAALGASGIARANTVGPSTFPENSGVVTIGSPSYNHPAFVTFADSEVPDTHLVGVAFGWEYDPETLFAYERTLEGIEISLPENVGLENPSAWDIHNWQNTDVPVVVFYSDNHKNVILYLTVMIGVAYQVYGGVLPVDYESDAYRFAIGAASQILLEGAGTSPLLNFIWETTNNTLGFDLLQYKRAQGDIRIKILGGGVGPGLEETNAFTMALGKGVVCDLAESCEKRLEVAMVGDIEIDPITGLQQIASVHHVHVKFVGKCGQPC